ncbi:MAG TPA: hypothetical protein VD998_03520 [Verrucomicrobiae bacterium]|nr:hypothetical protein [Verrucomicrobiae bacterium]
MEECEYEGNSPSRVAVEGDRLIVVYVGRKRRHGPWIEVKGLAMASNPNTVVEVPNGTRLTTSHNGVDRTVEYMRGAGWIMDCAIVVDSTIIPIDSLNIGHRLVVGEGVGVPVAIPRSEATPETMFYDTQR